MNPELQKELAAWLIKLKDAADAGASFALEQAPLIVQEKVAYGRISAIVWVLIPLVLAPLAVFAAARLAHRVSALSIQREELKRGGQWTQALEIIDEQIPAAVAAALCGIGGFVFTLTAFAQIDEAIKVWFAPRLYVAEWLAGLLK